MIRAMIETSLIDWDGKLSTVLFFDRCNFMCPFCQNWDLILHSDKFPVIEWRDIEAVLLAKQKWIDGVVLTGGEPLMHRADVCDLAGRIKALDFLVKIDTNGAYPDTLDYLIERKLVDYVAMDLKAPLDERYSTASGSRVDIEHIKSSIKILMKERIAYEFRTTCVRGIIDEEAIADMGSTIRGAKKWILQQYLPDNAYLEEYRRLGQITDVEKKRFLEVAYRYVSDTKWRGR